MESESVLLMTGDSDAITDDDDFLAWELTSTASTASTASTERHPPYVCNAPAGTHSPVSLRVRCDPTEDVSLAHVVEPKARLSDWDERVGKTPPRSLVLTLEGASITSAEIVRCGTPLVSESQRPRDARSGGPADASDGGPAFATPLAPSAPSAPSTLSELMRKLAHAPGTRVRTRARCVSPGYVVTIQTSKCEAIDGKHPLCHYRDTFAPPSKPSVTGTARLTRAWFASENGATDDAGVLADVLAFVRMAPHDPWFMVLADTKLPTTADFPLGGGFYECDLSHDYRLHRERWGVLHHTVRPEEPDAGTKLIGGFVLGDTLELIVDGAPLRLAVDCA